MRVREVGVVGLVLFVLSGCSSAMGSQPGGKTESPEVEPVAPQKLMRFLVDLKGWEANGPAEGVLIKTKKGRYSEAERYYTKEGKELDLTITDGAKLSFVYEDFEDWRKEVGSSDPDVVKSIRIGGFPALEIYEPDLELATLMVLVKDRILVVFELDGATAEDDLKPLARSLDWKGLAGLIP